jgi:biotin-dependent carboxylase-like uncharacterized protein
VIRVISCGPLATIQDLGRYGYGHLGVPRSGPVDAPSHRFANRLVGNATSAATIEALRGGLTLQFVHPATFAICGAPAAAWLSGRPIASGSPVWAPRGATLSIDTPVFGHWSYLAFRGGIDVTPQLGSRSTDTLSGLGPAPLAAGDELPIGDAIAGPVRAVDVPRALDLDVVVELEVTTGPRFDWFTSDAHTRIADSVWTLSSEINRVAARLTGPTLELAKPRELPTEGIQIGSIQVPPSGQPIVHLANHPPTGGYPVIGIVDETMLPRLAQALPGTPVRFSWRKRHVLRR